MTTSFAGSLGADMFVANPQAQQFVATISALYRQSIQLYDPDKALLEDPNAWSKVMADDRFRAYIAQRLAKVARIQWVLEPASDRRIDVDLAATVEPFIREIPALTSARRHAAKFAFWGRSHLWIEGRRQWRMAGRSETMEEGILAEWWTPTFLRPLDKRQVIYQPHRVKDADGKEVVTVRTLLGTIDAGIHREMQNPECLITCVYDDEVERLGYGRGLLETLYQTYWLKGVVRRIGLSGLEKWCHGIVAARVDANARLSPDTSAQDVATQTLAAIAAMRSDGAIVLDKNDELEVLTTGTAGQDATQAWLTYFDEGAAQLCLSAIRPMGGKDGGAYNQGEVEAKSTEDLLDCDRELIDEQITRTLVQLFCDLNAAPLAELGLAGARTPRFRCLGLRDEDPEKAMRVIEAMQRAGMAVATDDAYRRAKAKRPAEGEDILEAPKPAGGLFGDFGADNAEKPPGVPNPEEGAKAKFDQEHGEEGKFPAQISRMRAFARSIHRFLRRSA